MPVRIEIDAPNADAVRAEMRRMLGDEVAVADAVDRGEVVQTEDVILRDRGGEPQKRRGRPPKNASPEAQAVGSVQPAVTDNTGSTETSFSPPGTETVQNGTAAGVQAISVPPITPGPAAAAPVTEAEMRQALLTVANKFGGGNKAGMEAASKIIFDVGKYTKVKDIKPEHYAAVKAAAEAKMREAGA